MNLIQDKTITSISFIGSHPPRAFNGSFDNLDVSGEEDENNNNNKKRTKIFVQNIQSNSFIACSGRFLSARRFLTLLRRSRPSDVFVFSGTCVISPNKAENEEEASTTITPQQVPSDAFLWFSGESSESEGSWLSGREISKALLDAKNVNMDGQGGGVLYLNCSYACFAAQPQFFPCSSNQINEQTYYNFNLTKDEKLTHLLGIIATTSSKSKTDVSFAEFKQEHAAKLVFGEDSYNGEALFRKKFVIPYLHNCELDRSQLPLHIVPLSMNQVSQEDQDEVIDILIFDRFFKHIPHLSPFHEKISSNIAGAVIWSENMILTRLFPQSESHQRFLFSLFKSESWERFLGVMSHIQTLEDSKSYIENRPLKMFREHGVGSFAIVVPMEKEVSVNETVFDQTMKRNAKDQEKGIAPSWTTGSFNTSNQQLQGSSSSSSNLTSPTTTAQTKKKVIHYQIVGIAGAILRPEMEGDFDLGFALLPEYHGRGYATIASNLVLHWARNALGLKRIRACTAEKNLPSLKLLEHRLGFTKMFNGETRSYGWNNPNFILEREL